LIEDAIRAQLLYLETALATRDARGIEGGLATLIADDFVEHGASGAVWDATATRALVASQPPAAVDIEDFVADALAPGVVLATYRVTGTRASYRVSVWVHRNGRWVLRFHQGTLRPS
jgi:hypothetical protein